MQKPAGRPSVLRPLANERAAQLLTKKRYITLQKLDLPGDCDAVDRFLVGTHSDLDGRDQATLLGVSRGLLQIWRRKLYDRGLLDPARRASHIPISDAEMLAVAGLFRDGWSWRAIALMREITVSRVQHILERAGVTARDPRARRIGAVEICALFGLSRIEPTRWVARGWLPDYRIQQAPGARHGWDLDDVIAVIRNRATWLAWSPAQVSDPQLRALAERERRTAGGAWFHLARVAALLNINVATLRLWSQGDNLFADVPRQRWSGAICLWLTDQQQAELAGLAVRGYEPGSDIHRWAANAMRPKLAARFGRCQQAAAAD